MKPTALIISVYMLLPGFPDSSLGEEYACNEGDLGSAGKKGRSEINGIVIVLKRRVRTGCQLC